jgi:predicted RNA methylase
MRKKKNEFDKFYTKPIVASQLISLLDLTQYSLIIEPSAGAGAFSNQIPNCLALDIAPENSSITKTNFLEWEPKHIDRNSVLVIGNPPFGQQCSLALKFIKHSTKFASTIAFILPKSFKKDSIQSKIPLHYHLVLEQDLDDKSYVLNGKEYSVPSVFQIWKENLEVKRLQKKTVSLPNEYKWTRIVNDANIAIRRVGVNAGKAFEDALQTKSVESHYFLAVPEDKKQNVVKYLNDIKWQHNNTTGPRSISKTEFTQILFEMLYE